MIDARLTPILQRLLTPPARVLQRLGLRADQISLGGFALGLLAVIALSFGQNAVGLGLIALNRLADGLDGALARLQGPTDRGAFLDIAMDFAFYALIPLGFAIQNPGQNALAAAALIASFMGTGSSFLAFAALAAKRGITAPAFPKKGIYYLGGLTEGAETIAVFATFCLWPTGFAPVAWIFAAACAATTVLRWRMGWVMFGKGQAVSRVAKTDSE